MITIKQLTDTEAQSLEGDDPIFDNFDEDFDQGQFGHNYTYYEIKDLAYWNAFVCYDTQAKKAVGCYSQAIGLKEATKYLNQYLND